jgi:hypothetical protein
MNNEKFRDIKFMSKEKARRAVTNLSFVSSSETGDDFYIVEKDPLCASCDKPLQSAFATLSNAKYWFVTFVYKFLFKCLDQERMHFIVCDTDSYMWAVSDTGKRRRVIEEQILKNVSKKNRDRLFTERMIVPHFEDIVSDREFYEKNYNEWFPSSKKKKLLTLEYEHCCVNLVALAPKNYWCDDGKKREFRSKGVSTRGNLNQELTKEETVLDCLQNRKIIGAENMALRQKNNKMTKQTLRKTGLSAVHTKMIVLENEACLPFIEGISANNYYIE